MSFECPTSTSEDKQLALRGLEHRGRAAVDHGGGGGGGWGVIIYPLRPARLLPLCNHRG